MAKNHYIVKRKGGGGGIEYICFQSSLIFQILDTKGFNSTNTNCQESRQINNAAPPTASKIKNVMKFVVKLLIVALPFLAFGQVSNNSIKYIFSKKDYSINRSRGLFIEFNFQNEFFKKPTEEQNIISPNRVNVYFN